MGKESVGIIATQYFKPSDALVLEGGESLETLP